MRRNTAFIMVYLFYLSIIPANAEYFNYRAHDITSDGGRISGATIGKADATDNAILNDLIVRSPWVDVRAHGAACDNVTDDSANINTAMAAATKAIYIPGPCVVNAATITGKSGINIFGNGRTSELRTTNTSNFSILTLNAIDNVKISGVTFSGNAVGTDPVDPVIGIDIKQTKNIEVTSNVFSTLNYGIRILDTSVQDNNTRGTHIHHNKFLSAYGDANGGYGILHVRAWETLIDHNIYSPGPFGRHGVYLSAGTRHTIVDHENIEGTRLAGISVNSGTNAADAIYNVVIDTFIIKGSGVPTAYAYCLNVTGGLSDSKIINGIMSDCAADGMYIQAADASMFPFSLDISHNQVISSQGVGIALYDIRDSTIMGNLVRNSGLDNASLSDIILGNISAVASYNTFIGNQARSSLRWGINLGAATNNNSVRDTTAPSTTQEKVIDNGTGNRLHENFNGIQTASIVAGVLTVDAAAGSLVKVTVDNDVTVTLKTYSAIKGQPLEFIFIQNGTGGYAVAFAGSYETAWVDTGNTANKVSSIKFIHDGTKFQQVGAQMLYH